MQWSHCEGSSVSYDRLQSWKWSMLRTLTCTVFSAVCLNTSSKFNQRCKMPGEPGGWEAGFQTWNTWICQSRLECLLQKPMEDMTILKRKFLTQACYTDGMGQACVITTVRKSELRSHLENRALGLTVGIQGPDRSCRTQSSAQQQSRQHECKRRKQEGREREDHLGCLNPQVCDA